MGDYTPIYQPGIAIPFTVGATPVVGGNLVSLSVAGNAQSNGSVIPTTAATGLVMGVATTDAAVGARVTVIRGGVQEVVASAAIAFGLPLKSAANGTVAAFVVGTDPHDQLIGYSLTATTGAAQTMRVLWV